MDFLTFMSNNGLDFSPVFDGKIHRFKGQSKKSKSGWYVGNEHNNIKYLLVGDFADPSFNLKWSSKSGFVKSKEFNDFLIAKHEELSREKEKFQELAAEKAKGYFEKYKSNASVEDFEYCKNKKITNLYGAQICEDRYGFHIAIPIKDINQKLTSIQRIYSDGTKLFLPNGKIENCFFTIGDIGNKIYVCEGFATGISIHEATGASVVVAFNAGNIERVIKDIKSKYVCEIIIAADNDQWSKDNAGIYYAKKAAQSFNVKYIYPKFLESNLSKKPTDFNDLYLLEGKETLLSQLTSSEKDNQNLDEYLQYKALFEDFFKDPKKCFLTNIATYSKNNKRQPIENDVALIKAECDIAGLPVKKTDYFLSKWIDSIPAGLNFEILDHDNKKDYISEVLSFVSVSNIDHAYFVELMKEWFAGIFKRLKDPNYQNKMVIFWGDQGLGKDTLIKSMLGDLGDYFSNSKIHDKENENFMVMQRSIVVNISEFDRTSRVEVSQLKNIITADSAVFRSPYSRKPERVDFRTSFISSCNIEDIFRDETGNRRYVFFKLSDINWQYPKDLSKKIIGQAKYLADLDYKASLGARNAMDLIIKDMTPEPWQTYAKEIWETRASEIERTSPQNRISSYQAMTIAKEMSIILGISSKSIQAWLGRVYKRRDNKSRFYVSTERKDSGLLENK